MSGLQYSRWADTPSPQPVGPAIKEVTPTEDPEPSLSTEADGTAADEKVPVPEKDEVSVPEKEEVEIEIQQMPDDIPDGTPDGLDTSGKLTTAHEDALGSTSNIESSHASPQSPIPNTEKPLPPISESEPELPLNGKDKALPEPPKDEPTEIVPAPAEPSAIEVSPVEIVQPDVAPIVSPVKSPMLVDAAQPKPTRPKSRVTWRGKNCVIRIPRVDFTALGLPMPMSAAEVAARLKGFEDAGYNVSGFDLAPEQDSHGLAFNRAIFPDEAESQAIAAAGRPHVTLPDLRKWAEYTDWLVEQKLAALGVSLGGDEPSDSQSAQDMSRQSSVQYPPLPFSPPIPAASANSMGRPGFIRGHSHTMSVASPISPANVPQFGHGHRASIAGLPGMFAQQQSMQQPGFMSGIQAFSPSPQLGVPGLSRVTSPGQLFGLRDVMGSAISPLHQQLLSRSPQDFSRSPLDAQFGIQPNLLSQIQPRTFTPTLPQLASVRQTPALPELPEEDDEEEQSPPESKVEVVAPSTPEPQKAVDPASTIVEESSNNVEPSTYVPPHKRAQINEEIAVPTPRGHRHNISENLERDVLAAENRHEVPKRDWMNVEEEDERSNASRNSRRSIKSQFEKDPLGYNLPVHVTTHARKRSTARFNVAAPVFTFNPTATFTPMNTNFTFEAAGPKLKTVESEGHSRKPSSGTLNVAAPVFRPQGIPKTDFSFSAQGPSFPPEPTLEPTVAVQSNADEGIPSIFGQINIPDIIKPSKKSKAITIVRPEDARPSASVSATDQEDGGDRIGPSDDRLKRQRFRGDDGDDVPRFASPTPEPDAIPQKIQQAIPTTMVLKSQPELVAEVPTPAAVTAAGEKLAHSTRPSLSNAFSQGIAHGHSTSGSLSALAKPFQPASFQPLNSPAKEIPQVEDSEKVQETNESISELEEGEMQEDEVPTSPLRALEPILSESQRNSFVPLNNKPASPATPAEPSFAELDSIMQRIQDMEGKTQPKTMEDGLVDRQISPLPVSPVRRPVQGAGFIGGWPRNDAPSPSPRRRAQLYQTQGPVDSSYTIHERTDSGEHTASGWPHVTRLNRAEDVPTSDWSGILSPPDEEKLHQRSRFFDSHIDDIIGRVVEQRLQPLEESLRSIENTVNKRTRSIDQYALKRSPSTVPESDADDEDDHAIDLRQRPISRGRDKRVDQIKVAVLEALREQSLKETPQAAYDIVELHSVLADMKVSFARAASSSLELDDIRAVVAETLKNQGPPPAVVEAAPISNYAQQDLDHKRDLQRQEELRQQQDLQHKQDLKHQDELRQQQDSQHRQELQRQEELRQQQESQHKHDISELEVRLNETLAGTLEEANRRRVVEEREAEGRRLLRLAEDELKTVSERLADATVKAQSKEDAEERESETRRLLEIAQEELTLLRASAQDKETRMQILEDERSHHKEVSEENERKVRALEEERVDLLERLEQNEGEAQLLRDTSKENINKIVAMDVEHQSLIERADRAEAAKMESVTRIEVLETEVEAMQSTLDEYRISRDQWRVEIDEAKRDAEEYENTIAALESQLEDGQDASDLMKRRLEKLHADMATAAGQLATEKAEWKSKEDSYRKRYEVMDLQRTAEAKERFLLEEELRTLRAQAAEFAEVKGSVEQLRTSNVSLENVIQKLQTDVADQRTIAARFERDYLDAKEGSRSEIHRAQMAAEGEVEAANHKVSIVRAELESELARVRSEMENAKAEAETARARHGRVIEEEDNARREAVRKANSANSSALEEARQKHEAALQEINAQHARALSHAVEDKHRSEAFLSERLALSDEKLRHYQERTTHLEERLEVSKSALQAAAQNAQAKGITRPSAEAYNIPSKISPQALRESILVLQEQLQDRETQIDRLKHQVESEGTAKLKERDTEISWLRELLTVRNEELGDLIRELSKPNFDRQIMRDTAIRIRANLDMQLQERERLGAASPTVGGSALATLSNFATPRAAQLSSAFSKWRSAMENPSLKNSSPRRPAGTPSRAPVATRKPSGFAAGLMTPPASNIRNTPSPEAMASLPPPRLQRTVSNQRGSSSGKQRVSSSASTMPLFRKQSYDQDAQDRPIYPPTFGDGEDEEDLNVDDTAPPPGFRSLDAELGNDEDSLSDNPAEDAHLATPLQSIEPVQD